MKKAVIVLQARIDSKRLPGKVLKPLQGLPLLAHCIRRLKRVHPAAKLIVATSVLSVNDEVVRLAEAERVSWFRGSENDVLDRFYRAACHNDADYVIRATGDNPFVDPDEASRILDQVMSDDWDYVCGFKEADGLVPPTGVAVEAFTFKALEQAWHYARGLAYREHIDDYFFDESSRFKIRYLPCLPYNHCPNLRLTVDTIDDLTFAERIGAGVSAPLTDCTTAEIIRWWKRENEA